MVRGQEQWRRLESLGIVKDYVEVVYGFNRNFMFCLNAIYHSIGAFQHVCWGQDNLYLPQASK